jgi:glycyl-tRNA synthetase beta chain
MPDFLLEVGCEEIPARMLDKARQVVQFNIWELLGTHSIAVRDAAGRQVQPESIPTFSTPRRIGLLIRNLPERQQDKTEVITGPALKIAFKEGRPTQAAEAFAKKVGRDVSQLEKLQNEKGEYICATVDIPGRRVIEILAENLPKLIGETYWEKTMYWRGKGKERFVRPVRWIVALFGKDVIPFEFAGIKADRISRGHRVLCTGQCEIREPADYESVLQMGAVMASRAERYKLIWEQLVDQAGQTLRIRETDQHFQSLLDTVTNLTEWPSVIRGSFDESFLSLPEEILVTVMRDHQKYFAVEDAEHKLAPHFLAVLNTDNDSDGLIRHGNERVLRARFNDARFFWDTDQKIPLTERVKMLGAVTFQKDLGSYYDKTARVINLATSIAEDLRNKGLDTRSDILYTAAQLSKADLTAELVKEFTELQGIIGGLYVRAQGIPGYENDPAFVSRVADAIYDQYKPASMEDRVPSTLDAAVLSIADKADSIVGMFAIGLAPSGSKDPLALRRQANGIIKTLAESSISLSVVSLLIYAFDGYRQSVAESKFKVVIDYDSIEESFSYAFCARRLFASRDENEEEKLEYNSEIEEFLGEERDPTADEIASFFRERIQHYLRDFLGLRYDIVNAVIAAGCDDIPDLVLRAQATSEIANSDYFEPISAAFKRMKNILQQARQRNYAFAKGFPAEELGSIEAEKLLAAADSIGRDFRRFKKSKNYASALTLMSTLRGPIDRFFDSVMVMVDDEQLRARRLGLVRELVQNFSTIADFSEIVTEKK